MATTKKSRKTRNVKSDKAPVRSKLDGGVETIDFRSPDEIAVEMDYRPDMKLSELDRRASNNFQRWRTEADKKKTVASEDFKKRILAPIESRGVRQPIVCVFDKSVKKFHIIDGYLRTEATASCGRDTVPALVFKGDIADHDLAWWQSEAIAANNRYQTIETDPAKSLPILASWYETFDADTFKKMVEESSTGTYETADHAIRVLRPYLHATPSVQKAMERGTLGFPTCNRFVIFEKEKGKIVGVKPRMSDADSKKVLAELKSMDKEGKKVYSRNGRVVDGALEQAVLKLQTKGDITLVEDKTQKAAGKSKPAMRPPAMDEVRNCIDDLFAEQVREELFNGGKASSKIEGTRLDETINGGLGDYRSYIAFGLAMARGIQTTPLWNKIPDEKYDAYESAFITYFTVRAYGLYLVNNEDPKWLAGETETGDGKKAKKVKNSKLFDDAVEQAAILDRLTSADAKGKEVVLEGEDITMFDRVCYAVSSLNAVMSGDLGDEEEDEE